jgi:hypothetical protein
MFLTAMNLLCTLFTGSLPRKNTENNFSSRLLALVKLSVNLGSHRPSSTLPSAVAATLPAIHGSTASVVPIDGAQFVALTVRQRRHLRELSTNALLLKYRISVDVYGAVTTQALDRCMRVMLRM